MIYELKILAGTNTQKSLRVKSLTLALAYAHALSNKGYAVSLKRVKHE